MPWKKNLPYVMAPIQKEYIFFPEAGELKHYYESTASAIMVVQNEGLKQDVTYTLNEQGLNERFDYAFEKPSGTYRVLTLGDSFTFGDNVNTQDNWPEQLEDRLNASSCSSKLHFEAINLGMSGYDMQYELERFRRLGVRYKPDLIVWFLNGERWNELMWDKLQTLYTAPSEEDKIKLQEFADDYYPEWRIASQYVMEHYSQKQRVEQYRLFMKQFTELYQGPLVIMTRPEAAISFKMRLKILLQSG